jgi:CubicO group peptidase (beta-lactamase class C family)
MTREEKIERWKNLARDAKVPGVAIAVLDGKEPVWSTGFGLANATSPVTSETIFEAASLSKQVIAFATLKLCKTGLLELDTPLAHYVPEPNLKLDPRLGLITVRHVLSHTSGLPNWMPESEIAVTQFQPGTRFSYSGIGFAKLQAVIEEVTNTSLENHIQETIFQPLKMQHSSFVWREDFADQTASGHDQHGTIMLKDPRITTAHAAFSLHSTVLDLAMFLKEFLRSTNELEMLKPQVQINQNVSWGLGWGLEECTSGQFFWQWGNNPGFRPLMAGARDTGFGLVVLTNGANGDKLWKPILEDLTGVAHPALAWLEDN